MLEMTGEREILQSGSAGLDISKGSLRSCFPDCFRRAVQGCRPARIRLFQSRRSNRQLTGLWQNRPSLVCRQIDRHSTYLPPSQPRPRWPFGGAHSIGLKRKPRACAGASRWCHAD